MRARPSPLVLPSILALALALAPSGIVTATEAPCYGHVAYVLPVAYICDGPCETTYTQGLQTGCQTTPQTQ